MLNICLVHRRIEQKHVKRAIVIAGWKVTTAGNVLIFTGFVACKGYLGETFYGLIPVLTFGCKFLRAGCQFMPFFAAELRQKSHTCAAECKSLKVNNFEVACQLLKPLFV